MLLSPLLKTSADLWVKQMEYEKSQLLISEAERVLELIGRAIRMAGYRNVKSIAQISSKQKVSPVIEIQKNSSYQGSDSLLVRHELSDGVDFDCIGNALTIDRTKHNLALQGFLVERQAGLSKSTKFTKGANGANIDRGSLICQSLDRHGRIQNTTLMNSVSTLKIDDLNHTTAFGQKAFRVRLTMTDGAYIQKEFERTFTSRNLR